MTRKKATPKYKLRACLLASSCALLLCCLCFLYRVCINTLECCSVVEVCVSKGCVCVQWPLRAFIFEKGKCTFILKPINTSPSDTPVKGKFTLSTHIFTQIQSVLLLWVLKLFFLNLQNSICTKVLLLHCCIFPPFCSENGANVTEFFGSVPCWTRYLDGCITSGLWTTFSNMTWNDLAHYGVFSHPHMHTKLNCSKNTVQFLQTQMCQTSPVGLGKCVCVHACECAHVRPCIYLCLHCTDMKTQIDARTLTLTLCMGLL